MKKQLCLLIMPAFGNDAIPITGMPISNPSLIFGFTNTGRKLPSPRYSPALAAYTALHISGTVTISSVASFLPNHIGKAI